jgi:hypothetical protein
MGMERTLLALLIAQIILAGCAPNELNRQLEIREIKRADSEALRLVRESDAAEARGITPQEAAGVKVARDMYHEYTKREKEDDIAAARWFYEQVKDKHLVDFAPKE